MNRLPTPDKTRRRFLDPCLLRLLSVIGTAVILTSCATVGPDYERPVLEVQETWSTPRAEGLEPVQSSVVDWWTALDDPILNEFVAMARLQNNTLEIAGLRVLEAQAILGIAIGIQYPQSQFTTGGVTYVSPSEAGASAADFRIYDLSANVAWELDFWGKFRRGVEAADASLQASIADFEDLLILLTAQVVDTYVVIRTVEERLRIAQQNIEIQERSYNIARVLFENGEDSQLDVQQALTLLLGTRATVPALEQSLRQARNALTALLGHPPGILDEMLDREGPIPDLPVAIAIGVPADLLRQRPDVRRAELVAVAQNAQVGGAKAGLYPSFSLSGSLGAESGGIQGGGLDDLFSSDAVTFAAGAGFVWPFLNYGRIKNSVRVEDAQLQQALIAYQETVIQAAREVEDAMAAFDANRTQGGILAETVESAQASNELAVVRYAEGFSGYERVLDSQRALFTQQDRYVRARGDTVRSLVSLYKALGGGWQTSGGQRFIDPATQSVMQDRTDWGDHFE